MKRWTRRELNYGTGAMLTSALLGCGSEERQPHARGFHSLTAADYCLSSGAYCFARQYADNQLAVANHR